MYQSSTSLLCFSLCTKNGIHSSGFSRGVLFVTFRLADAAPVTGSPGLCELCQWLQAVLSAQTPWCVGTRSASGNEQRPLRSSHSSQHALSMLLSPCTGSHRSSSQTALPSFLLFSRRAYQSRFHLPGFSIYCHCFATYKAENTSSGHNIYIYIEREYISKSKHVLVWKLFTPHFRPSWTFFKACPVGLTDFYKTYIYMGGWGHHIYIFTHKM